jgi:hypothetical protein
VISMPVCVAASGTAVIRVLLMFYAFSYTQHGQNA